MKVAVTSQGLRITDKVDPRFGRAGFFIVVDTDNGEFSAHDNKQNLDAVQGAGIQAAQNVIALGAEALLTGNVGPKAFAVLESGNVGVYVGAGGTVRQAIEQFSAGELECASEANVAGHWS